MSISLQNVKLAPNDYSAEKGWGFSEQALLEARDLVAAEAPDATPLIEAIEEAVHTPGYLTAEHHGRKLIAATGWRKPSQAYPIEGLMYVEGGEFVHSTFTRAKVSQWVSAPNRFIPQARHLRNGSMTESRVADIRRRFYEIGLGNWDDLHRERGFDPTTIFWGLPVNSNTLVEPIGNQEGDIQVPFCAGDWVDVLAVSGLKIPAERKALIIATVAGAHAETRLETLVKS